MHLKLDNGIEVEGLDFHLDAHRKANYSFVSHAHTDHTANHRKILATPETILFFKQRYQNPICRAMQYGQKTKIGDFDVELHPAGHILGCAQISLENKGRRIVYTGDFKLDKSATTEPATILKSDVLIMESTYGRPDYIFPKRDNVIDQLITFVQKTLLSNQVPIILAYSLGKSQEAIKILGDFGFDIYAEETVYKFCKLYKKCGVEFQNLHPLKVDDFGGKVIVFPPYFKKYKSLIRNIYPRRTCFLSGWALDNTARFRTGADVTLPLSDHADYNDLIKYVEESNPSRVFTLHGFPEFADDLKERGFDAVYLDKKQTASLSGGGGSSPPAIGNYDLFL
jgi:putative mRNA 3-end processing factor